PLETSETSDRTRGASPPCDDSAQSYPVPPDSATSRSACGSTVGSTGGPPLTDQPARLELARNSRRLERHQHPERDREADQIADERRLAHQPHAGPRQRECCDPGHGVPGERRIEDPCPDRVPHV